MAVLLPMARLSYLQSCQGSSTCFRIHPRFMIASSADHIPNSLTTETSPSAKNWFRFRNDEILLVSYCYYYYYYYYLSRMLGMKPLLDSSIIPWFFFRVWFSRWMPSLGAVRSSWDTKPFTPRNGGKIWAYEAGVFYESSIGCIAIQYGYDMILLLTRIMIMIMT